MSFGPSELGTKEYWDNIYSRDAKNFEEFGDIGEIWFGEDSVEKMVDWVTDHYEDKEIPIIDLGCGNGHLLLELSSLGFTHLTGVDYSVPAVELSQRIAAEQGKDIAHAQLDLLDDTAINVGGHSGKYGLALDKGTFDAISLSHTPEGLSPQVDKYAAAVAGMLVEGGVLLITSCNFTEEEVMSKLNSHFHFTGRIKYPTFTFGGVKGQTIVTIAVTKKP